MAYFPPGYNPGAFGPQQPQNPYSGIFAPTNPIQVTPPSGGVDYRSGAATPKNPNGFDWRKTLLSPEVIGSGLTLLGGAMAGDPYKGQVEATKAGVLSNYLQNRQQDDLQRNLAVDKFNPLTDQSQYQSSIIRNALLKAASPTTFSGLPAEISAGMPKVGGGLADLIRALPATALDRGAIDQAYAARQMDRQLVNPRAAGYTNDPSVSDYAQHNLQRQEGQRAGDQNMIMNALNGNFGNPGIGAGQQIPKGYEIDKKTGQLKKKGGFWSKFGKIAGIVGGGALTALSGGAASPLLAAALGAGGGALTGVASGGGWKGALLGAGLGAAGGGAFGGAAKNAANFAGYGSGATGSTTSRLLQGIEHSLPQAAGQIDPRAAMIAQALDPFIFNRGSLPGSQVGIWERPWPVASDQMNPDGSGGLFGLPPRGTRYPFTPPFAGR